MSTPAPTAFSYTPTGRAVPSSAAMRPPAGRLAAPSCTPTGRVVVSAARPDARPATASASATAA